MMVTTKLTKDNYYSIPANKQYMSVSQYKSFLDCEARTMAEINGEYTRPYTTSLLVGSYVDAYFEKTLDNFFLEHPEVFKKDGTLKSEYLHATYIISRIEAQPKMMHYFSGEKQKIFTGMIAGVQFKCKVDSYLPDEAIVDGKVMKDFSPIYKGEQGRLDWFEAWGYDKQGAIYQELVRQNTGKQLPFILNAATKEAEPDLAIIQLSQEALDFELKKAKEYIPRFDAIKQGLIHPVRCENCDYCRRTKVVDLINLNEMEYE